MKIKEDIKDDVKLDDVKEAPKKEAKTKKTPAKKAAPKKVAKKDDAKDDGDDVLERLKQAYPSLDKIFVDKYGGVFTYKAPETKEYKLK